MSTLKLTRRSFVLDMISKYLEIFLNSQLPKTRTLNLFNTNHHLRKLELKFINDNHLRKFAKKLFKAGKCCF